MNGILIVDKPANLTSHDVVSRVRRAACQKKVGHAGTLDPLATGVLVLALGQATRTIEYLTSHDKVYEAVVQLGAVTDTYDAEGQVVRQYEGVFPTREQVETSLSLFRGDILQKPPIFSAIKKGGEPLHKKARRGEQVEIAPRPITIYDLILTGWNETEFSLHVRSSKGTYIRSLAYDIGEHLGVGAHLKQLRRIESGMFTLADAHSFDFIMSATPSEIEPLLLPVGIGLDALPSLVVDERMRKELSHGRPLSGLVYNRANNESVIRAIDEAGTLMAILGWDDRKGWQPKKVFIQPKGQSSLPALGK